MFKQAIEEGKKGWKESQAEFLLSRGETFTSLFLVKNLLLLFPEMST